MRSETVSTRARRAGGARHDAAEDEPVLSDHVRRIALEGEVVDRDDGRARAANGNGVLRVDERCADAPEQPRQRPGIRSSCSGVRSSSGSIPSGTSSGLRVTAANRSSASSAAELAQQIPDIGLVAGAAAAEHVGVDDDERLAHAIARR